MPRVHESRVEEMDYPLLAATAAAVSEMLGRLHHALDDPPFTAVHGAPRGDGGRFHWHIHVWPRTSILAGFEYATGAGLLTVDPKLAAAVLRESGGGTTARL